MTGKEKCQALREIRARIAQANGLPFEQRTCGHDGPCSGTCPRCEREVRQLEEGLRRRARLGKRVAVAGLCAGMVVSLTGCSLVENALGGEAAPSSAESRPGAPASIVTGELPYEPLATDELTGDVAPADAP